MKKAVIYARVSTAKQAEEGLSIEAQTKQLRDYAANEGYEIVREYVDEGASAKTDDRPQFQEMISDIKSNKENYDAVLIHKTDRFARNREDSIVYKSLLRRDCNVDVISITEDFGDGPIGKMIEGILEVIAEFYSENLSKEVLKGMNEKAKKGEALSMPPYGYEIDATTNKYAICKEEAKVIKYIFEEYINGKSMQDISLELNRNGKELFGDVVFQKKSKAIKNNHKSKNIKWPVASISQSLKNKVYIGTYTWKDTVIENNHPAIISKEDFELVQTRINSNARQRSDSKDYLLKGLVTCYECGGNMSQHTEKYKKANGDIKIYRRLRCTNHVKLKNCYSNMHRMDEIERELINYLKGIVTSNIDKSQLNIKKSNNNKSTKKISKLKKEYDEIDKKFDKQMEAFEARVINLDQLQKYKERLKEEKDELGKKIEQLEYKFNNEASNNNFKSKLKKTVNILEDNKVSLNEKKNILLSIADEIKLSKKEDSMQVVFKL